MPLAQRQRMNSQGYRMFTLVAISIDWSWPYSNVFQAIFEEKGVGTEAVTHFLYSVT
jgi:hypothetical protein